MTTSKRLFLHNMRPLFAIALVASLFGIGCDKGGEDTKGGKAAGGEAKTPEKKALSDADLLKADWADVEAAAKGGEVRWFFWSGNPTINGYLDNYVIPQAKARYDIEVTRVPMADVALAINRLLAEKKGGNEDKGRADMIWLNGENFRTAHSAKLLYGPFAERLPNRKYVNGEDPAISHDFGVPTEGHESPWCRAQFVMIYDTAKIESPPRSIEALSTFIAANPGRFTYPAPPDFTGSAFLRHVLYETSGGHKTLSGDFDEARWGEVDDKLFGVLKAWSPNLWRKGATYPESSSRLHQLFSQGEVWMSLSYGPETASAKIKDGQFPKTARTYLLDKGTIGNTSFVAIPFNSPNKAAAMVLANFLLSPEAQAHKQDPKVWGTMSVLDPAKLDAEGKKHFEGLGLGVATLPLEKLVEKQVPEINPAWAERLEKDWVKEIARGGQE